MTLLRSPFLWLLHLALATAGIGWLHRHGLPWDAPLADLLYRHDPSIASPRARWWLDKESVTLTLWLHEVPRYAFMAIGGLALAALLATFRWNAYARWRKGLLAVVLSLALVPATVAGIKAASGHYCPGQLARYGGPITPEIALHLPENPATYLPSPRCFPAAHPSAGFALVALGFLPLSRRGKALGVATGLAAGGVLSAIQIARGEHFLSHAFATLWIALLFSHALLAVHAALPHMKEKRASV